MAARGVRPRFRDAWNGSFLYGLLLRGRTPPRLSRLAPPPHPGDAERGAAIVAGKLVCAGRALVAERPEWTARELTDAARIELNSFEWLDDVAQAGGEVAQGRARSLVEDWATANPGWRAGAWDAEPTGRRIAAWLTHAPFLSRGDGDHFGPMFLESLCRQSRHLARSWQTAPAGIARLRALRGLIYAHSCGVLPASGLGAAAAALGGECARQLHTDGFHVERGPGAQFAALSVLVDCRMALEAGSLQVLDRIHDAIDRLAPAVRFFRHGDGGFALFENSNVEDPRRINEILSRARCSSPPPERTIPCGFERVAAERTLVLMDAGMPPGPGHDAHAHAGTLAFEMSAGRERIVVNCGAGPRDGSDWSLALRATAAHSTLVVEDTSTFEPVPGGLRRRMSAVSCTRDEADGNVWLEASHDGYVQLFGLLHRRRLFVARDGRDIRGEDSLVPAAGAAPGPSARFALRFHLSPDIQASVIQNGAAALLRTPGGHAWRFQISGAVLELGESVSFALAGSARRSNQLIASGTADENGATIKWAIKSISNAR